MIRHSSSTQDHIPSRRFATIPAAMRREYQLEVTNRPVNDHFAVARFEGGMIR